MKYWAILLSMLVIGPSSAFGMTNDEVFAHAQNAYQSKNVKALAEDARQLSAQNYLLAPYADYWLMLITLSTSEKTLVKDFLAHYPDYPFTDRVRAEWLKSLAKRQDWDEFFGELAQFAS
jgi:soluble lytic murein transglycosylase